MTFLDPTTGAFKGGILVDIGTIFVVGALVGLFVAAVVWMEMQSRRGRDGRSGSDKVGNER